MKKTVLSIFALFLVTSALAQGLSTTPNQPIGEGKGIFPGRVVWAMNPEVSKWDGATGRWWDEGNIDMELLENMYEKSICVLAGSDNVRKAWDKIFKYHNKTHGRGNRGYRQGETIAVKINLNNTFDTDDNDNDIYLKTVSLSTMPPSAGSRVPFLIDFINPSTNFSLK